MLLRLCPTRAVVAATAKCVVLPPERLVVLAGECVAAAAMTEKNAEFNINMGENENTREDVVKIENANSIQGTMTAIVDLSATVTTAFAGLRPPERVCAANVQIHAQFLTACVGGLACADDAYLR